MEATPLAVILPMALAVASSPIQIVPTLNLLDSSGVRSRGTAFALGWIAGLAVVGGVTLALVNPARVRSQDEPWPVGLALQLTLGLVMLVMAYRQWAGRPKRGEPRQAPAWMIGVEDAPPIRATLAGMVLAATNSKIVLFTVSAMLGVAQTGVSRRGALAILCVYIAVASATVIVPVVWHLLKPGRAGRVFHRPRMWLTTHDAVIVAVVLLLIGAHLVGKGVTGFIG